MIRGLVFPNTTKPHLFFSILQSNNHGKENQEEDHIENNDACRKQGAKAQAEGKNSYQEEDDIENNDACKEEGNDARLPLSTTLKNADFFGIPTPRNLDPSEYHFALGNITTVRALKMQSNRVKKLVKL
jgi:hypothetical protein